MVNRLGFGMENSIDKKAFKIEGDGNCEARDYRTQGFHEIDVGMYKKDYTLTFEDK